MVGRKTPAFGGDCIPERAKMMRAFFGRFSRDARGLAAVEFAMLAPVLIAFYFGLTELCSGYMANKRSSHIASMVADLTTQQETVSKENLGSILQVSEMVMRPFSTTNLRQRVTSITVVNGKPTVDWSWGDGLVKLTKNTVVTIPADLISEGQSIVMSETEYDYESPMGKYLPGKTQFKAKYYLRPRTSDVTLCTDC